MLYAPGLTSLADIRELREAGTYGFLGQAAIGVKAMRERSGDLAARSWVRLGALARQEVRARWVRQGP